MNFSITIQREPEVLLRKVCSLAGDRMIVQGDTRRGRFSGLFDGSYSVDGTRVNLHIRRKPAFVTWSLVRRGLDYLSA